MHALQRFPAASSEQPTRSSSLKSPEDGSGDATCRTYAQPDVASVQPASDDRSASAKVRESAAGFAPPT